MEKGGEGGKGKWGCERRVEEEVMGGREGKGSGEMGKSHTFVLCQLESSGFVVVCHGDPPSRRRDCGYPGISKNECSSTRWCCWDDSIPGVKWCFFRGPG